MNIEKIAKIVADRAKTMPQDTTTVISVQWVGTPGEGSWLAIVLIEGNRLGRAIEEWRCLNIDQEGQSRFNSVVCTPR